MRYLLSTKGKRKVFLNNKNQFGVFLNPTMKDGEWTGEVEVNLAFADSNDLDDDSNDILVQVITMMAASIELMKQIMKLLIGYSALLTDAIQNQVEKNS